MSSSLLEKQQHVSREYDDSEKLSLNYSEYAVNFDKY